MAVIKMYMAMAVLVIAFTGMLIGTRAYRVAHTDAIWAAEEAGRQAVTAAGPRPGPESAAKAAAAAQSYLSAVGVNGSVTVVSPREVTVTTHVSHQLMFFTASASDTKTAQLLVGVEKGQ